MTISVGIVVLITKDGRSLGERNEGSDSITLRIPNGEVVLPEEQRIIKRPKYLESVEKSEPIILNNALSKALKNPEDWSKLLVANYSLKKRISLG